MTPEREDWLTAQYVWAIENESEWHKEVNLPVQIGRFGEFRRRTANYINATSKLIDDDRSGYKKLKDIDWAFIVLTLWLDKGGSPADVLVDPGALRPVYKHLLQPNQGTASVESVVKEQPNEIETQEEIIMTQATTVAFVTKSYIYGKDVEQMSEGELISAIRSVEAEIGSLKTVQTPSKKIAAKIEELQDMLAKIVGVLDGK